MTVRYCKLVSPSSEQLVMTLTLTRIVAPCFVCSECKGAFQGMKMSSVSRNSESNCALDVYYVVESRSHELTAACHLTPSRVTAAHRFYTLVIHFRGHALVTSATMCLSAPCAGRQEDLLPQALAQGRT